jgi:hypothetical protein
MKNNLCTIGKEQRLSQEHREAIRKYGTTKYHRMTFKLLPEQLSLDYSNEFI